MKKIFVIIISFSLIFLFNVSCALEIANVIGPDGGYVFYDKGNYNHGWRYIQCSPYDFGEIKDTSPKSIRDALDLCSENNAEWHKFGWELPDEADLKKMLECFSYGLTRFSPDYYYLSVNNLYDAGRWWKCAADERINTGNLCSECGAFAPAEGGWIIDSDDPPNPDNLTNENVWDIAVLHKNFEDALNGKVEKVTEFPEPIRIRAIRRF